MHEPRFSCVWWYITNLILRLMARFAILLRASSCGTMHFEVCALRGDAKGSPVPQLIDPLKGMAF